MLYEAKKMFSTKHEKHEKDSISPSYLNPLTDDKSLAFTKILSLSS